ncbi:MAG: hypothetical protein MUO34_03190, partial [Ignavibacteriaceae bacterium]|nr:hypothetical protein [Ignavibacteriaceae bacterium]
DKRLEKYLSKLNVDVNYYSREIYEFGGVRLYILNDDSDDFYSTLSSNYKSGMMKLVYGHYSFLFTGDVERKAEEYYVKKYGHFLDVDILKVPHHGSKTSSTKPFLDLVSPKISVISVGIKNKFNHPSQDIIERLEDYNTRIYRTDLVGAILMRSNGKNIEMVDWK